jgi:hypothetical protein
MDVPEAGGKQMTNELNTFHCELHNDNPEIIFFLFNTGFGKFRLKSACHDIT